MKKLVNVLKSLFKSKRINSFPNFTGTVGEDNSEGILYYTSEIDYRGESVNKIKYDTPLGIKEALKEMERNNIRLPFCEVEFITKSGRSYIYKSCTGKVTKSYNRIL